MAKAWKRVPEAPPRTACPICGGTDFRRGPGGRTGPTGVPPRCAGCGSLERHRAFHILFAALTEFGLKEMTVLQFSEEPTLDPDWFARREVSVFGGTNSLDLCAIDRPDASYGIVFCNNVLEHVPDDDAALSEMLRVVRPEGFIFLSVPDPVNLAETRDWGYPDEAKHGHYRLYGRDLITRLKAMPGAGGVLAVTASDPVSGVADMAFFLAPHAATAARLEDLLVAAQLPGFDIVA